MLNSYVKLHVQTNELFYCSLYAGSITDGGRRHHITMFLYAKAMLCAPELFWLILGTFWAFGKHSNFRNLESKAYCEYYVYWNLPWLLPPTPSPQKNNIVWILILSPQSFLGRWQLGAMVAKHNWETEKEIILSARKKKSDFSC